MMEPLAPDIAVGPKPPPTPGPSKKVYLFNASGEVINIGEVKPAPLTSIRIVGALAHNVLDTRNNAKRLSATAERIISISPARTSLFNHSLLLSWEPAL